ncbi:GDSL esterase/lipase At5g42170 [Helianthus annuus]|nr:GDSL esterase/lipase At5g42170 [Helianthus annuus]
MKVILFCLYASFYITSSKGTMNLPKNVSVQAILAFGDSILDTGNNNYIQTWVKANFPPYGRDFMGRKPTGRFSNGKIVADVFAKELGVKEYLPAYLDPSIQDKDLQTGVSFASAGSGYDPLTTKITSSIPLPVQLDMFKQYIGKLVRNNGKEAAKNIISNSVYFVSASTNDFIANYFTFPTRRSQYDIRAYNDMLVKRAVGFVQDLHKLGARKIVVLGALPIGCLPIDRTVAGGLRRMCVDKYNKAAQLFNSMLIEKLQLLASSLPQSKVAYGDIYNPLLRIIENPQRYGLEVTDRGCCGTGIIETAFACNKFSPTTCSDPSKYLFWDSVHPSENGYSIYVDQVLPDLVKSLF